MKIVSVDEMIRLENDANNGGLSYDVMMRNAGNGIALWMRNNYRLEHGVIGLVGSGNNGGDTLIALSNLASHNVRTFVFLVKQRKDDPLIAEYLQAGGVIIDLSENNNLSLLHVVLLQKVTILDGMLGTGFRLPLRGALGSVMGNIHKLIHNLPEARIIAVDCPSGVDCDTGEVSEHTLHAKTTLTMAAIKQGLLKYPAKSYAGEIELIRIGIPIHDLTPERHLPELINTEMINRYLPSRSDTGHKGTFGTSLVIAGTEAFTGAAYLAGKAAYRSGCGLVHIATHASVRNALAGQLIEAVWTVLPECEGGYDSDGVAVIQSALESSDALVIGPGWGLHPSNLGFLENLIKAIPNGIPAIFDADGLKILSRITNWWKKIPENTVLTPHPGEMSVLTELKIKEIEENRWKIAEEYAQKWGVTLVIKGAMTVVGTPSGQVFINPIGDSALATAGSGDVLSGIIGGLLAQRVPSKKAAILGVWTHGEAGQKAHKTIGSASGVTALDILNQVGKVTAG